MKLFVWLLMTATAFGQVINGIAVQRVPPANFVQALPGAIVTTCSPNDTAVPCTQLVTTYTDQNFGTACSATNGPVSGAGCSNPGAADANGNYSIFVPAGNYMVCVHGGSKDNCVVNSTGGTSGGTVPSTMTIVVSPTSINFGTVQTGTPSQSQPIAISNSGNATVAISGVSITAGAKFSLTNPTGCNGAQPPGATCILLAQYSPTAGTSDSAVVTVNSNAAVDPTNPPTVTLSGSGTATPTFPLTITNLGTGSGIIQSNDSLINCFLSPNAAPSGACTANYASGSTPTLTFTPSGGGTLVLVTGCTINNLACVPTISAATTITATFTAPVPSFILSITGVDQGIGTVTSDLTDIVLGNPLNCTISAGQLSGTCAIALSPGAQPVLTETPSASCTGGACTFVSWGGVSGCTSASTCQPTVNSNTTVSADFAQPAGGAPLTLVQKISGGSAGGASIAFVKACQKSLTAGASFTSLTNPCTIAAGDAACTYVREAGTGGDTITWTITDSASQTWTQTASSYQGAGTNNFRTGMHCIANTAALTSITANFNNPIDNNAEMVTLEFSGMAAASLEDSSVDSTTGTSSAFTSLTSGALTTTNANDVLLYCVGVNAAAGGFTVGAGYTIPANGVSNDRANCQYKIVAATQTGVTTSTSWVNGLHAGSVFGGFKGAAASTTVTGNWAGAQNAGDFILCGGQWNDNTTTVTTLADTAGNTYTQFAASPKTIAGLSLVLYHADNILASLAGANTTTLTLNASPSTKKLVCLEYSGAPAAPLDSSAGATGTGTAISTGNVTTGQANDLLVGFDSVAGTITATSPNFTSEISTSLGDVEDRPVTTATTYAFAPTQNSASNWAAIVAAMKTSGTAQTFTVTLTCPGNGLGFVAGSGFNAKCSNGSASSTFSIVVNPGAILSFTATPVSPGSAFVNYNGAGCGTSPSCTTQAIVSNTTIAANFVLSGANAFYVNPSTGSDSNPGTQALPWATLAKANLSFILGAGGTVIHGQAGTYASSILLTRGGSSSSVRVVYQCDPGTASAIAAIGQCKIPGSVEIDTNNLDLVGFDIGNNANAGFTLDVDSDLTGPNSTVGNSIHAIGNYMHDVGANVSGNGILGCPQNGMIQFGNHAGSPTDGQILRNIIVRFGIYSPSPAGCNTAQGIAAHGNPVLVYDNIVGQMPVGAIVLHDACRFTVSNNTMFAVKSAMYLGTVDGTCPFYGQNTIANNYMFAMFGSSAVFHVSGTPHCDATHQNLYSHNMSDGSVPDFDATFSCDVITPAAFVHQAAASFLVNPVSNGAPNTWTGDYHLKAGSSGILGGLVNNCVTGGTFPCTPLTDFAGTSFPTSSPIDVGAYKF